MRNAETGKAETPVTVVGAGPVGSLLSLFLARRGYLVEAIERRPDMRVETISAGRSINLALSVRGLHALERVGLASRALAESVPMYGRMMHARDGGLSFQPYGKDDSDCIYSISRGGLNRLLMTAAEATGRARIRFQERAVDYEPVSDRLRLEDSRTGSARVVAPRVLFGTDGSASAIRHALLKAVPGSGESRELLDYGYKELTLPPGHVSTGSGITPTGREAEALGRLARNALHIWPRGNFMLIALPNFDGSFTCTLFLPFTGEASFERLETPAGVREFFRREFPDVADLFPALETEFFEHPVGTMVTIRCSPWSHEGRCLLLGDAAHAIVPFFGQGMNCGFEDCVVLEDLMIEAGMEAGRGGHAEWRAVFERFFTARKPDADAIADLAVENFVEMRAKVADPRFLLEKQVERVLQREFPEHYVSRYSMVTFSRIPYRRARELGEIQSGILSELCRGIGSVDELDLGRAGELVRSRLGALAREKG